LKHVYVYSLSILPASEHLSSLNVMQSQTKNKERRLLTAFKEQLKRKFDHIIIGCPPKRFLLTVNAMIAAREIVIPVYTEFFATKSSK